MPELAIKPSLVVQPASPVQASRPSGPVASQADKHADAAACSSEPGDAGQQPFASVLNRQLAHSGGQTPDHAQGGTAKTEDPASALLAEQTDSSAPAQIDPASLLPLLTQLQLKPAIEAQANAQTPAPQAALSGTKADSSQAALLSLLNARSAKGGAEGENIEPASAESGNPGVWLPAADFAVTLKETADSAVHRIKTAEPPAVQTGAESASSLAGVTAHALPVHQPAPAEAPASPIRVETPIGQHGWDAEVGQKLVWMVGRNEQRAELVLTPPNMGKIEVSVSMSGDQANAMFISTNPTVRDALEQALPRLRELLADAGVTLGQTSVSADSGAGQQWGEGQASRRGSGGGGAVESAPVRAWLRAGEGLVDTFA